jgi:signal transduction histidine kinase
VTLRARLTLWYSGLLAGVLIVFGTAVYTLLSYSLTEQVNDGLLTTAEDIRRTAQRTVEGSVVLPRLALDLTADVKVQLWSSEGQALGGAEELDPVLAGIGLRPEDLDMTSASFRNVMYDGSSYRILLYPLLVEPEGRPVGYLQLARSMDTVDRARESLLFLLVVGGILAVGTAGLVGWTTAGAALRPIDKVTETALNITRADDLSRRIPRSGPPRGEIDRLALAFNETLERLEGLFETQRRFLADVSHELRTPLTTIRGNVDLIRRIGRPDPESLEAITTEVDRMTRMVNDLLLLAQAESGRLPLAEDEIELDTLMLEVFKQAKLLGGDNLKVEIGREDQVRVLGDRDRLKQVLLNLVANAVDNTPAGGKVTLALACVEGWARLTVSDTGRGIPQEELPHIFERFYRIDSARKRNQQGGAGLGLSIAYWITRAHKGRLEVASEPGKGTTFSVWLPRVAGECEPGYASEPAAVEAAWRQR